MGELKVLFYIDIHLCFFYNYIELKFGLILQTRRISIMDEKRKHHIHLALMFGAYIFLHTTTLLLANRESNGHISAVLEENLYYIQMFFMILGLLSFAPVNRLTKEKTKFVDLCALIVLAVCIVILYTIKQAWVFVGIGSVSAFCLGYLGALVYWRMSKETVSGSRTGLVMGIGCAAAYTLQYFLEGRGLSPVLPFVIVFALAALGYVLLRYDKVPCPAADSEDNGNIGKKLVCAVIITSGLIFFNSFFNGYMHHLQIQSGFEKIDAYAWPRLMLVPTYLGFGVLGDIKHGKYIPMASLCMGLATLLHSVLAASETANWINMCLFYFGIASAASYFGIVFWNLAPKTSYPELWASVGRSIDALAVIVMGILKFSSLPVTAVLSLNIAVIAVLIITMAVNGDFNVFCNNEKQPEKKITADDAVEILRRRYSLTPSEMKVAKELLLTDDKQSDIAERLSIKVGTIQFHATNIYRKAGVENRAALRRIYNNIFENDDIQKNALQ